MKIDKPTIISFEDSAHDHEDAAGGAQLDHGLALTGLDGDDHTQYLLASDATDRATFVTNWTDLTDTGDTTLHDHDGITENTSHRTADGSSHTFIDQSVISGATPTFTGTNFTGIPVAGTSLVAGTNITLATNTLNVDDAFLINNGNDVTTGGLEADYFHISATAAHTITDSSDDLVITNPNAVGDIKFNIKTGEDVQHDFLQVIGNAVDSQVRVGATTGTMMTGAGGLLSFQGSYTSTGIKALLGFSPTIVAGTTVALYCSPTINTSNTFRAFQLAGTFGSNDRSLTMLHFEPSAHAYNYDDNYAMWRAVGNRIFFAYEQTDDSNVNYNWIVMGGAVTIGNLGEGTDNVDFSETMIKLNGGATRNMGTQGSLNQLGLEFSGFGTSSGLQAGDSIYAMKADGGTFHFDDNTYLELGTGGDARIYYDATDLIIDSQVVGSGTVDLAGQSYSALSGESVTGYFTMKIGGVSRKIAIVA